MNFNHTYTIKIFGELDKKDYSDSVVEEAIKDVPNNLAELIKDELNDSFIKLLVSVKEVTPHA